jgi:Dyp-type peroxidase family
MTPLDDFAALLGRSSLGTARVRALAARTAREVVDEIKAAVEQELSGQMSRDLFRTSALLTDRTHESERPATPFSAHDIERERAMTNAPVAAGPGPDAANIQGNLVGFNKDHQRLMFLRFSDAPSGKAFLTELEPQVARAEDVRAFNAAIKAAEGHGAKPGTVEAAWTNIALTFPGLQLLGAPGLDTMPEEFKAGMRARAAQLGDVDDSDPTHWLAPFDSPQNPIHAMVILAADDSDDLNAIYADVQAIAQKHGTVEAAPAQDGNTRPGANAGHEHFGFKDGISQPGIDGLTESSKTGQDQIAAGEFIIGYPDEDGHISGQGASAAPQPGQPGYPPSPSPTPAPGLPPWTKDGSFVVYRRLRQNVAGFQQFLESEAPKHGLNADQLGAKLVGRWRTGAPLERTPDEGAGVDPAAQDPSTADPTLLTDAKINNFDYAPDDADGHLVPRAAHIRKTNPRSEDLPGKQESNRRRLLRRGAPYGPDFVPNEQPYPPSGPPPADQDRGLLFICYQASIANGFEFIQETWVNKPNFPSGDDGGDGRDPIISQDVAQPDFRLAQGVHLTTQRWVTTTGGEYLFSPSVAAIHQLTGV